MFLKARLCLLAALLFIPQLSVPIGLPVSAQTAQEAEQLYQLGVQQFNQGQFQQAFATFEQVLQLFRERGDRLQRRSRLEYFRNHLT